MLVGSVDLKDPLRLADFEERQMLKDSEDRLIDMLLIFDATCDTITSLLDKYQNFRVGCDSSWDGGNRMGSDLIVCALQERQEDVQSSRNKVKSLHKKVQGTTNLVSKCFLNIQVHCTLKNSSQLSSLLDHGNGSSLKQLAEEARKENITMRQLTEKSTKDAAAVKVLTIITLVYLPATVVSVSDFEFCIALYVWTLMRS